MVSHLHPSARLKLLRESLHFSQREMAQEFNVSSGAIASWELGANPVPGSVIKLMDIYEMNHGSEEKDHDEFLKEFRSTLKHFPQNKLDLSVIESGLEVYLKDSKFLNQIQSKIKYSIIKNIVNFLNGGKGLTIKIAQLASYLEMGLPIEVRLALGNLQSSMKPMNKKKVQAILEETYGCPVTDIFSVFDYDPLAVTSLGQVHYGKRKTGEEVAIKIQSEGITKILEKQFEKLKFLEKIRGLTEKDSIALLKEIQRAILNECDYLLEAKNQDRAYKLIGHHPRIIIPKVHFDLVRPNVLVTEFIKAENFHSFCQKASRDSKNIVGETLLRGLTRLAFSHRFVMGDIHPENFLVKNDKVVFLDFGRIHVPFEQRFKYETHFYRCMVLNEKEKAKSFCKQAGFAKDESNFNFDEFWTFLRNSSLHLIRDEKFKFTREYASMMSREGRRFAHKKTIKLNPDAFWGFAFSAGTWSLYSELEVECNWHRIALETFNEALSTKSEISPF